MVQTEKKTPRKRVKKSAANGKQIVKKAGASGGVDLSQSFTGYDYLPGMTGTDMLPGQKPMTMDVMHEYGTTGLFRFGGRIWEEFLKELQGPQGVKIYKEMAYNDATCSAILYAIEMIVRQVDWRVEAGGSMDGDEEAAQFLESCLFDDMEIPWEETLAEILTMLTFGWSWFELVYKKREGPHPGDALLDSNYDDGRIGWRKWGIRAQESLYLWHIDDYGGIEGMIQMAPPHYHIQEIPMEKSLLFRVRANKGSPEGRSLLRHAYRSWFIKKNLEELEAIGVERDLVGIPIGWVPPEIAHGSDDKSRQLKKFYEDMIINIHRNEDEGIIMPSMYDKQGNKLYNISLLGPGGQRAFSTDQIISRYDMRIAMTVLADFLFLGQNSTGTYALAETRNDLFAMSITSILDAIQDVINSYAVPKLFRLNAFDNPYSLPRVQHGKVSTVNLNDLGNFVANLGRSGIAVTDPDQINYLLRMANMPEQAISAAITGQPQADTTVGGAPPAKKKKRVGMPGGTAPEGRTAGRTRTTSGRPNAEEPTGQPIENIPGGGYAGMEARRS